MESKDITLETSHRRGSKINGKKRAIIIRLLDPVLNQYRQKQLWKDNIYVNQDYSEHAADLRKQLFQQAKEFPQSEKSA